MPQVPFTGSMTPKAKKAAFVFRYFCDRSFGQDLAENHYSYICESTTSYDDGMEFCDAFAKAFPGRSPDPQLTKASARLSTILRELARDNWMIRWRLGNEGDGLVGSPKWQFCYKLPQDIINALKRGTETPESLASRWAG